MKKIYLGLVLIVLTTINVIGQVVYSKDTIFIHNVPVGSCAFDTIKDYLVTDVLVVTDERILISLTNFNVIPDNTLKTLASKHYGYKVFVKKTYNIDLSKYQNIDVIKACNYNIERNLTNAGELYNARLTLTLLGSATSIMMIRSGDIQGGLAIGGMTTVVSIILDYCGNRKLKLNK